MPDAFYNAMVLREPYSGVEVTVHQLACALSRFGSLPVRFCVPPNQRPIPPSPHASLHTSPAGRFRLTRILWEQTALPALLRRCRAPLLHAPAYVAPLASPCPVVLTVHDLHALTHPQFCSRANRLHYGLLLPPSIRRAAAIIAFSDYTKRRIAERFPEAEARVTVIPPGVADGFAPCADQAALGAARRRYSLPDEFLLFVGDLSTRKNIPGLLGAFSRLARERPGLHLVLAGAADAANAADADRCARALGVAGRVRRTGYVAREDLPALYTLAQAFVFPSHDEGFGLPPLEAMACGCPVVCSGVAPAETCGDAALSCDPQDGGSIAEALGRVLGDAALRQRLVALGARKAAEHTWQRAALATETLYRALLNKGTP